MKIVNEWSQHRIDYSDANIFDLTVIFKQTRTNL